MKKVSLSIKPDFITLQTIFCATSCPTLAHQSHVTLNRTSHLSMLNDLLRLLSK